jgi:hypothetical protein
MRFDTDVSFSNSGVQAASFDITLKRFTQLYFVHQKGTKHDTSLSKI